MNFLHFGKLNKSLISICHVSWEDAPFLMTEVGRLSAALQCLMNCLSPPQQHKLLDCFLIDIWCSGHRGEQRGAGGAEPPDPRARRGQLLRDHVRPQRVARLPDQWVHHRQPHPHLGGPQDQGGHLRQGLPAAGCDGRTLRWWIVEWWNLNARMSFQINMESKFGTVLPSVTRTAQLDSSTITGKIILSKIYWSRLSYFLP